MTSTSESERAFVAALKAFDVPRLQELIDAGTMSLDDLKDFKTRAEQLLAHFEWRMDRGMSCNKLKFYIDDIVPKQKRVIALLESAIRAQLGPAATGLE
jgi:hypothetical protein